MHQKLTYVPELDHRRASASDAPEQDPDLVRSDRLERVETGDGEYLERGEATEVAPVVAVGRGDDGHVVVAHVLSREELRPVGQNDVVFREAFFRGIRGRDHHQQTATEPEGEDGTQRSREGVVGPVEGEFHEVEVP